MNAKLTTRRRKRLQRLVILAIGVFILMLLLAAIWGWTGPGVSQDSLLRGLMKQVSTITSAPTLTREITAVAMNTPEYKLPAATPDPLCVPPCFYGIFPGRTSAIEAISLLGGRPEEINTLDGSFRWKTKAPTREWYAPDQMIYNDVWFREGIVQSIVLNEQQDITLDAVVTRYGPPASMATGNPGGVVLVDIYLIYPSRGIALLTRTKPRPDSSAGIYIPERDMLVDETIYFSPLITSSITSEVVEGWRASGAVHIVYPWAGFRNATH